MCPNRRGPHVTKVVARLLRIRKAITVLAILSLVVFLDIAAPRVVPAEEAIKIGGVGSALGTMKMLASAYEKSHPGIRVAVMSSIGSKGALKAVPEGAIDIGLLAISVKEEELRPGLSVLEYARTPSVYVTRNNINMDGLTTEEIIRIYRGDMRRWPGGEKIRLIMRRADDTDTNIIKGISPGVADALYMALSRRGLVKALTDQDNLDLVERTPGGLGFTTLTQVMAEKRRVKILSFNGVFPGVKTLADRTYPLSKTFSMLTKRTQSEKVRRFIDFVRSKAGAGILRETGNLVIGDK